MHTHTPPFITHHHAFLQQPSPHALVITLRTVNTPFSNTNNNNAQVQNFRDALINELERNSLRVHLLASTSTPMHMHTANIIIQETHTTVPLHLHMMLQSFPHLYIFFANNIPIILSSLVDISVFAHFNTVSHLVTCIVNTWTTTATVI